MVIESANGGIELSLRSLRVVAIVAPAIFLALMAALSISALKVLIVNDGLRTIVIFSLIAACIVPFAVWLFQLIERQQRSLAQSSALIESVTEHAIFMLDREANVLSWNPGAERINQYAADEIIGRPFSVFYTQEDGVSGLPERHLDEALRLGHLEYEGWRVRKDGSRFWAAVTLNLVRDSDGEIEGFAKITQDRTEQQAALERIALLNQQLETQVEYLRAARELLERQNLQLAAVNNAIGAISGKLGPAAEILQRIVDSARDLVQAQYAAVGVADDDGNILRFITSGIGTAERTAIGPLPLGRGLLGALIKESTPIRIPTIADDPRSVGFPANHPPMSTFLGVPITYHGETVGNLYMTDKAGGGEFTAQDEEVLVLLSRHAAVAIANTRLYEAAQQARDDLQAWNERLEYTVRERTREVEHYSREMTLRILEAQESERKRIARELHDETAQSLATVLIHIDMLESQIGQALSGVARESLLRLRDIARRTLDETRALSYNLRPSILDDAGLAAALNWYADEWSCSYDAEIVVETDAYVGSGLPAGSELTLFRVAQEALANVGKHARATAVRVRLARESGNAVLEVTDDGQGFEPGEPRLSSSKGGLGLYGIRERVELAGGTLRITGGHGKGTRICVTVPGNADPETSSLTRVIAAESE